MERHTGPKHIKLNRVDLNRKRQQIVIKRSYFGEKEMLEVEMRPFSLYAVTFMNFELSRAFRILCELDKPKPDFTFLDEPDPFENTPGRRFNRIIKTYRKNANKG